MMKKILTILILNLFAGFVLAQAETPQFKTFNDSIFEKGDIVKLPLIYFSLSGKQQIIHEHRDSLLLVRDFLLKYPKIRAQITCYTDQRGNSEANAKLSETRAKGIVNYLVKEGISEDRLTFFGYGESKPIISQKEIDSEPESQQKEILYTKNRRIEMIIL